MKSIGVYKHGKDNLRGFYNESEVLKSTTTKVCSNKGKHRRKHKYYAVRVGRISNIVVESWIECERLVKGYSGAKYKSFKTLDQAERFAKTPVRSSDIESIDLSLIKSCPF